jgi:energy-coupling factor transport system ATP-binding protein
VLAGALAPRPDLLLLDEPTANLDPTGAALIRAALAGLDERTTIVLVEHRIAEVMALVTRVVVLSPGGGVRADGPPSILTGPLGAELAEAGVWVPGHPLPHRTTTRTSGDRLLWTEKLISDRLSAPLPDLELRAGEALAVTGANGTGKSTLALLLGGLAKPAGGTVHTLWGDRPHRWRARPLAARMGSVFQYPEHQFVANTVRGELELGGTPARRVDELLRRLRLDHLARANPFTLSGGEGRRLSVATALAARPKVLLLDEPTFGQDRRTWIELVDLLGGLRDEGHGVIAVTHDPEVVASLADRTLRLGAS